VRRSIPRGIIVGSGVGDSASIVHLRDEALREEAVGFVERGSSYVAEGRRYVICNSIGCGVGASDEKAS